jgi:hypothetical protein
MIVAVVIALLCGEGRLKSLQDRKSIDMNYGLSLSILHVITGFSFSIVLLIYENALPIFEERCLPPLCSLLSDIPWRRLSPGG